MLDIDTIPEILSALCIPFPRYLIRLGCVWKSAGIRASLYFQDFEV